MIKITNEIRKEVNNYLEVEVKDSLNYSDELYSFYYRCMKANMDYADADRYAILNTLFNYDIGMENARTIDQWLWEQEIDIYDLSATNKEDKSLLALANAELGLNLDFSGWIKEDYTEYKFFLEMEEFETNDNKLREWCISNYASPEIGECTNCPYKSECDDFMDRHNGNTPLFG